MAQLTFEEAKRLSIKKWEIIVKNDGDNSFEDLNYDEEIYRLRCKCGFCHRYNMQCTLCEFGASAGICTDKHSIYGQWEKKPNKEQAVQILEIIKNLKEE